MILLIPSVVEGIFLLLSLQNTIRDFLERFRDVLKTIPRFCASHEVPLIVLIVTILRIDNVFGIGV